MSVDNLPRFPDLVVVHAAEVVTLTHLGPGPQRGPLNDIAVINDGAVAIADGWVVDVGTTEDVLGRLPGAASPTLLNATGCAVVPGFVDAHSHLLYAGSREDEYLLRLSGVTYLEISRRGGGIFRTVNETRSATFDQLLEGLLQRLDRAFCNGTTTAEVKTGYWLTAGAEVLGLEVIRTASGRHPAELVPTFLGAHVIPLTFEDDPDQYVDIVVEEMLPSVDGRAEFCDVVCDEQHFTVAQARRILTAARERGLKLKVHADEFADVGAATFAAEIGATSADHLCCTSEAGMRALAAVSTVAVILPSTRYYLLAPRYADARRLIDMGVPMALGSDHGPSSPMLSMPFVIGLGCSHLGLSPAEALVAATWNAAHAIGVSGRVGRLSPGYQADLLVLDMASYQYLPYFVDRPVVRTVIKKGHVFSGSAPANSSRPAAY